MSSRRESAFVVLYHKMGNTHKLKKTEQPVNVFPCLKKKKEENPKIAANPAPPCPNTIEKKKRRIHKQEPEV